MSALYSKARQAFLSGDIDWVNDTVKVCLIDSGDYSLQVDVHEFLTDVPAPARIATSAALTGKTAILGVADADDLSIPGVTGDPGEALVLFVDSGDPATSRLIAFIDGLEFVPNGAAVNIAWDNGPNGIFRLG